MKKLVNKSIRDYTKELARRTPTPGGGSSAALVGALGAALLEMSMGYSGVTSARLAQIRRVRLRLTQLVDKDARAYAGVVRSWEKGRLRKKRALIGAVKVPREICRNCRQLLEWADRFSGQIKFTLKGDWTAGHIFLNAAMKSASLSLNQNLKTLKKLQHS